MRLLTISRVVARYGLDELLFSIKILSSFRLLSYFTLGHWLSPRNLSRGARIRLALEELGPVFIKFGQILSTRRDMLPDDIAVELAKLQDRVAPFNGEEAKAILEKAYRQPLEEVFAQFNIIPIAAASIAQVHAARLHNGREVVIKILRPGLSRRIRRDIEVLYLLAGLAHKYWADGQRLRPVEIVAEFEKNLQDELDLMQEASNCALLRRNFQNSKTLYIPEVEWAYTQHNVMVLERVSGIPIGNMETLRQRGVNFKYLAEIGVEIFFTQVFRDNFFHADMHPGNVFIDITHPHRPHYIAIDFGIMGTLSKADQHYLAENLLAFFKRDYRRVAELHVYSEWVPANTKVEEFEGAIRSVCEPIFDRPIKDISFGLVLLRLFQTARRFNMVVQPQLVLLQKTLLNIEGMGRQIYPDLDLWKTAKPFLERWMAERMGVRAFLEGMLESLPFLAQKLPQMPALVHETLIQRQLESAQIKQLNQEIISLRQEMQHHHQRSSLVIVGSALIICASIILTLEVKTNWDIPILEILLGGTGGMLLLLAWIKT
jgi:ubiquinone biosynthesis protein